jgi:hypothetical protein
LPEGLRHRRASAFPDMYFPVSESADCFAEIRDEVMMSVLHQWALRDLETAEAWADSFPDHKLKDRALAESKGCKTMACTIRPCLGK